MKVYLVIGRYPAELGRNMNEYAVQSFLLQRNELRLTVPVFATNLILCEYHQGDDSAE